ncbi:MAG: 2-C-methyl-D-erythritol 4-phosphate cytidylyltransferase [Desulfomonile tiedjei]|uniref:2-C-methyl-D-erythritol 4-phosphate cytidylyltransferase n=1 Tax=Desulfomonile tiedjei TaxID=2358 RepID=A0A9D6V0T6_9BACT|nr:2-C-methyl-D-erythritol 4-phosphate cytidylyltransferase [Desulfomonile tiedjei]
MIRAAIVTAGGVGTRMGCTMPKQYLGLNGIPILTRTLMAFERHALIDFIVVTVPSGDEGFCMDGMVKPFNLNKVRTIVAGGRTRQESVYEGLKEARDSYLVAIHDGVRPLVSAETISKTFRAAESVGAALACGSIRETVKRKVGEMLETIPRSDMWLAHTPQTFHTDLILKAHSKALEDRFEATDDAALVERLGHPIEIVEDDDDNIKITTPRDMELATMLLHRNSARDSGCSTP